MAITVNQSNSTRIRRNNVDPVFGKRRFRTSATLSIAHPTQRLELRYSRSRWQRDPDLPVVQQRVVKAQLHVDGEHAGSFLLNELRPKPFIDKRRFFEWADAMSSELSELAEVICRHWEEVFDVTDSGTVLELARVWTHPAFSGEGRFALAANTLIGLSAEWSLLVLKAFPLEYEGQVSDGNADAYTRRKAAMMRHYRSTLGVTQFPGDAGDEGWMYLIRPDLFIPRPQICTWDDWDGL
jgi:hypothetical protein